MKYKYRIHVDCRHCEGTGEIEKKFLTKKKAKEALADEGTPWLEPEEIVEDQK